MALLELSQVTRVFGGLAAVRNLDMTVEPGAIQGLIGPNGSGKSTVFNIIAGALRPTSGRVRFKSEDITGLDSPRVVARGIARTFQATQVFGDFTVAENLLVASQPLVGRGLFSAFALPAGYAAAGPDARERVVEILESVKLDATDDRRARDLPHRDQKMLALASVLATGAELVMLDEPMAGLTVQETAEAITAVRRASREGRTFLLIEHDMRSVMELCDRIVVLDHGEKIGEGTPDEVRRDARVIATYLGTD